MLHCTWDVGYLPVSQRDQLTIKESLEHLSISDSLELSLKFYLYTTSSLSLNYLHWIGKQQEEYTSKKPLYMHGYWRTLSGRLYSPGEFIIMKMTENGSNRCASSYKVVVTLKSNSCQSQTPYKALRN